MSWGPLPPRHAFCCAEPQGRLRRLPNTIESLRSSALGLRSRQFASPSKVCAVSGLRRTQRPGPADAAAALAKRHVVPGALPREAPRVRLRFLCRQAAGVQQGLRLSALHRSGSEPDSWIQGSGGLRPRGKDAQQAPSH